jgi:Kef-type K+ transport system membrane component KefB
VGVSISVTAFPVLARILTDRKVHKTRLSTIAITCAAVDDATVWCLLAFVVCMAQARMGDVLRTLALPAFFAFTGLRTQIGLINGLENWLFYGLIILVACEGKLGGTLVAACLTGKTWRDAPALGILMNTRGVVELIVLNIGLDLGVISPTLFAMLVIMALVTTFMTAPLLDSLVGEQA